MSETSSGPGRVVRQTNAFNEESDAGINGTNYDRADTPNPTDYGTVSEMTANQHGNTNMEIPSGQQGVAKRNITFRAYFSGEMKEGEQMQVRSNYGGYNLGTGSGLCEMRKLHSIYQGNIWEGECLMDTTEAYDVKYLYGIHDQATGEVYLEQGIEGYRHVKGLNKGFHVTNYDGAAIFGSATSSATESILKDGFRAMQPCWLEEVKGEICFEHLLSWVDASTKWNHIAQRFIDAKLMLKRLVKEDIDSHITWSKDSPKLTNRLFLSMIGLIYRASDLLDISDHEIVSKFEKMIEETMNCNAERRQQLAQWKTWLDGSVKHHKKGLQQSLEMVMDGMADVVGPHHQWPFLIPLIHYMRSDCVFTMDDDDVWSLSVRATQGFEKCTNKWRSDIRVKPDCSIILKPFFNDDPLLSYNIMEMIDDGTFQKLVSEYRAGNNRAVRLDAILLGYIKFLKENIYLDLFAVMYRYKQKLYDDLLHILDTLETQELRQAGLHWQMIPRMAEKMLNVFVEDLVLKRYVPWERVQEALIFYLTMISLYQKAGESHQTTGTLENSMEVLWKSVEIIPLCETLTQHTRLRAIFSDRREVDHALILKRWEKLSQVSPANPFLVGMWNREWEKRFSVKLKKLQAPKVADSIQEVTEGQYLEVCTNHVVATKQFSYPCFQNPMVLGKLQLVVNRSITQTWSHCLNGTNTAITIEMLKQHNKFTDVCDFARTCKVSTESEQIIEEVKCAAEDVMKGIVEESCKLADFQALQSLKESFLEYAQQFRSSEFKRSMREASKQVEEYNAFATHICNTYQSAEKFTQVKPEPDAKLSFVTHYEALNAELDGREIVQNYNKYKGFTVFQALLEKEIGASKPLAEAVRISSKSTGELITSIENGSIRVQKLQKLSARHYGKNFDRLKEQLASFITDQRILDKVKMCVIDIKSHQKKAEVLLKLKSLFSINQEFSSISKVAQMADRKQLAMNDVDQQFVTVFASFAEANVKEQLQHWQQRSLEAYLNCPNFVDWVRRNITENSISTYVHIAQDLYPVTDDQAGNTKRLLDVLNGYAPLLFHFKDCQYDLLLLYQQCKKVWDTVAKNPMLPSQLMECNDDLHNLERVGKNLCNALFEAREINRTGVYTIEVNFAHCKKSVTSLSVNDVLQLQYGGGRNDNQRRDVVKTLSYTQLDDIQSRLALVGDGEEDKTIEDFQQLKDAVKEVADVSIEIRREACMQFENMKITVNCNNENEKLILVDFLPHQQLFGMKSEGKSNIDHCRELHLYLTRCVDEWKHQTNQERSLYKELNFFSAKQLVTLRTELSAPESDSCQQQGEPLLEMIYFSPIKSDELNAIVKECSTIAARGREEFSDIQLENIEELEVEFSDVSMSDIRNAVSEIGEMSVVVSGLDVYVECFARFEALRKIGKAKLSDARQGNIEATQGEQSLQTRLNSLWRTLMDHTCRSIQDLLSLRHLALVLQKLKSQDETSTALRNFSAWPSKGTPALVGIPSDEICKFVMSLYSQDASATYLTRNEVLFCDPNTSIAEVELFMSRALNNDSFGYCMVNCHVLNYEICRKIEKTISGKGDGAYKLVFVYDESKRKCFIRSCLDKFYIRPNQATDEHKSKIANQLQLSFDKIFHSSEEILPQENVDRHFVRLIRSNRAGVGKTLECENLIHKLEASNELVRKVTISIHKDVHTDNIVERLIEKLPRDDTSNAPTVIHIDIAPEVTEGVDELLFNLLILRSLLHSDGKVWQTKSNHFYFVECTVLPATVGDGKTVPELLELLPATDCISPKKACEEYAKCPIETDTSKFKGFDKHVLEQPDWQLVLKTLTWCQGNASYFNPNQIAPVVIPYESLQDLISNCGIEDPSWSELADFVKFLSFQISNVLRYPDCAPERLSKATPGIARFLVKFMVNMAKDFATHSVTISEHAAASTSTASQDPKDEYPRLFKPTKDWEKHDYPYLFFTQNGETFYTLGVCPTESLTEPNLIHLCNKNAMESGEYYTIPYNLYEKLLDQELLPKLNKMDFECSDGGPEARERNCQKLRNIMFDQTSYHRASPPRCLEYDRHWDRRCDEGMPAKSKRRRKPDGKMLRDPKHRRIHDKKLRADQKWRHDDSEGNLAEHYEQPLLKYVASQLPAGKRQEEVFEYEDVDENYVLTQDNAKKILAIYTRFTTDMPVIIMGETGCGKTKLVEFMTKLQVPTSLKDAVKRPDPLKIHSGTTNEEIVKAVKDADKVAHKNQTAIEDFSKRNRIQVPRIYTVLFFDEFNTTEEIGLIKEIMCDRRMNGDPLNTHANLKFIAACNPYRWLDKKMIEKTGSAGLGFNDENEEGPAEEDQRKKLVYQVHPMPESLKSLVWDFGTLPTDKELSKNVELKYIMGMVERMKKVNTGNDIQFHPLETELSELIAMAQLFMREHQDECSFVSLRDVERLLVVSNWFYRQRRQLFPAIDKRDETGIRPKDTMRSIMLGLGVCYISRLKSDGREPFASFVGPKIDNIMSDKRMAGGTILLRQIELCKRVFAQEVIDYAQRSTTHTESDYSLQCSLTSLHPAVRSTSINAAGEVNSSSIPMTSAAQPISSSLTHFTIAKSKLLKDNLFMMIPCVDTRIPLFVVGKPGTSKSLANSLIVKCMLGDMSQSPMFKEMKKMFQEPFQCSRHTTPEQIANALEKCRLYQKGNDPERFVSVALLDEIGLAEKSEHNPLKTLHALLETSCYGEEQSADKCGFIGISNYALDAAKMNRGLSLQLSTPISSELNEFARELLHIFGDDALGYVPYLTEGYLSVCRQLKPHEYDTEFFGLRDFYSFLKMVAHLGKFTKSVLEYCIRRNFSGFARLNELPDPVSIFFSGIQKLPPDDTDSIQLSSSYKDCVKSSLLDYHTKGLETRHKMIISENIGFLNVLLDLLEHKWDTGDQMKDVKGNFRKPEVIFGKAFEDDISYTQVCKNVYKIRLCAEKGKTVILLDVDDLHEGLYHLLNQSFYTWQGKRFVDLGIGIHRVPAHVHDDFRLLLIAGTDEAYSKSKFPTPLMNRFEKHYISAATFLDRRQKAVRESLHRWMKLFEESSEEKIDNFGRKNRKLASSFIGYNSEITALIVQKASAIEDGQTEHVTSLEQSKRLLLQCATAEAVLRLGKPEPNSEAAEVQKIYTEEQKHENLLVYLRNELCESSLLIQVTTFAEVMNAQDIKDLQVALTRDEQVIQIECMTLTGFRQEAAFKEELSSYYNSGAGQDHRILIIQCESANDHTKLLDYVRYILLQQYEVKSTHTILLLSLTRGQKFNSYQGATWRCVHIDDPKSHSFTLPPLHVCMEKKSFQLIEYEPTEGEEVDDDDELPPLADADDQDDQYRDMETDSTADAYLGTLRQAEQETVFPDLIEFIKWCLPQALSNIRSQHEKEHDRAVLLANLLTKRQDFRTQLLKHVRRLLEKQNLNGTDDLHWTMRAVAAGNMKKAETVRQALADTLEQEFRPALAVVIARIDPHRNLKLLDSGDKDTEKLWLEMFRLSQEIGLAFDQGLPSGIKMFHVGDENEMMFDVEFPFSWKVKEVIEKLRGLQHNGHCVGRDDPHGRELRHQFYKDPIGRLLTEVTADRKKTLLHSYLHDFIYLCHDSKPASGEFDIIERLIREDLEKNFPSDYGIPQIHIAYERTQTENQCLTNMATVLRLKGTLTAEVYNEIFMPTTVERVDIIALRALVNVLSDQKLDELMKDIGLWISEVDQCRSLTEVIIGAEMSSMQVAQKYKIKWPQLELKKLYVKHVIVPSRPDAKNRKKSHQMSSIVLDKGDYHKKAGFDYIVKTLQQLLRFRSSEGRKSASKKDDFEEISTLINSFFMIFACSNLVFPPNNCPDSEVLKWLIQFVTFRSQKKFDLLGCIDSMDGSSMLLYADPELLKCFFGCLYHQTMQHHFELAIWDLQQRCVNGDNHLAVLNTVIRCHQEAMKVYPHCAESKMEISAIEYPKMQEGWKQATLDAVQKISSLQMLVTSSVEQIYQTSGTVDHQSNQIIKLLRVTSSAGDLQPGYLCARGILFVYGESFAIDFVNSSGNSVIPEHSRTCFAAFSAPDIFEAFGDNTYQNAKNWLIRLSQQRSVTKFEIQKHLKTDTGTMLQAVFTTTIRQKRSLATFGNELVAAMARELPHVKLFLQNRLIINGWPAELDVSKAKGALISMLVLHMFSKVASGKPCYDNFPFHRILTEPENSVKTLLPTMPNGPLDNPMRQFDVQLESADDMDHLCVYVCPFGHPFIIKEDGDKHCSVCEPAGDDEKKNGHVVFSAMLSEIGEVKSRGGHILGAASTRSQRAKRVRQLNPLSCAVLRCLTHLSMLTSSLIYPDKVVEMISPQLADNGAVPFLAAHVWKDLLQISQCCGESIENCILLLHHILHELGRAHGDKSAPNLTDVAEREQWERKFDLKYIQPTFTEKEKNIDTLKRQMNNDAITQCSMMLRELLTTNVESTADHYILMDKALWEYEPLPTVEYLLSKLPATVKVHPAITALIEEYEVLEALKDLPNILKLANILSKKLHGKLNRVDASQLKIKNFIDEHIASFQMPKNELVSLVNSYISAWNACSLSSSHVGFADASQKSMESMVIEFLLDNDNMLLCHPLNLIRCLSEAQNRLFSLMTADAATDSKDSKMSGPLELSKVTPSQLLDVPNKDIIHQLLSKMHRLSEDGSTDHDLVSIQTSMLSDIVGSRRPLQINIDEVPFYKFEEDFQLWQQIQLLSHNQEKLSGQLKVSISEAVRVSNQLLNEDIKVLENVINHLSAMSQYKPEMKFSELIALLCMDIPTYLGKEDSPMRQYVKVKHILHIWLLLKYSQADLFMEHHEDEDPFVDVHGNYMDQDVTNIKEIIRTKFEPRHYRTREFLVHLFEFITLRLNKGISRNDEKSENPSKPISDALNRFLRRQSLTSDNRVIERLSNLPPQLLVRHAVYLWVLVWQRCFN